jgi:translation initiation factor 3 subunit L
LSRLECLLGDYNASLQALDVVHTYGDSVIGKDDNLTVAETLNSVISARVSLAYHAGIAYLQLRRYKDAASVLLECAATLQRGFKSGSVRHDQFNKQYERILSLLAVLQQICPGLHSAGEESVWRAVREKHGSKIEAATSFEEWFQSPKFIAADPASGTIHRQQVDIFNQEMKPVAAGKNLRSYLKLYTSLPVQKLANFHDVSVPDFVPLLLSYKARLRQKERGDGDSYSAGTPKSALDIHYYVENDTVFVDEAEMQRRFETYFASQIAQTCEIRQEVVAIDPIV